MILCILVGFLCAFVYFHTCLRSVYTGSVARFKLFNRLSNWKTQKYIFVVLEKEKMELSWSFEVRSVLSGSLIETILLSILLLLIHFCASAL